MQRVKITTRPGIQYASASTRMYLIVNLTAKIFWTVVLCSEKMGIMISTLASRFYDLVCLLICGISS